MANRWGIPKDVEELVKQRDLCCVYCSVEFTSPSVSFKSRPTWEHIINDIRINGAENISLCCGSCNASKGRTTLEEWLKSNYCILKGISRDSVALIVKAHLDKL